MFMYDSVPSLPVGVGVGMVPFGRYKNAVFSKFRKSTYGKMAILQPYNLHSGISVIGKGSMSLH